MRAPMQRPQVLFLVKFFVILLAAYLLIAWNPVNDHVIVPFTAWIARTSGWLLNLMGQGVTMNGTIIGSPKFAVNINNGCNGVEAMLILLASIGAFPAPIKSRAIGLLLGALAIQILNAIRIITLFLIGAHYPQYFDSFHTAVWQIIIILAAIVFFLIWSSRVARTRLATSS